MNSKVVIAAVGDIMPGDHPHYLGIGVNSLTKQRGILVFEYVKDILSEADIVFGNLETVLSGYKQGHSYRNSIHKGNPEFVNQLKKAHFNILNIANNHIQQHGKQSLFNTVDLLQQNDISVIGLDNLQPKILTFNSIKLGFLGYSLRPEQYANKAIYSKANEDKIISDITKVTKKVDCLTVSLHWGDEYVSLPSNQQRELAHKLIDSGSSIILGHHPHVLQGVEKYKHGVIAYSLGNFVSDMCQNQSKETMILKLKLEKETISFEIIPCKINNSYQPVPLTDTEKSDTLKYIKNLSVSTTLPQEQYNKLVKNSIVSFRKEFRLFLIKNWHKYPLKSLMAILCDFIRRRLKITRIKQGSL